MPSLLNLPFMRKPGTGEGALSSAASRPEASEDSLRAKVYRIIIDRYRELIEAQEQRSVSDLKGAVQPRNERISAMRESLAEGFHPYVYNENFMQAAKMAFGYVSSFRTLSLPVSFWLDFSEMQSLMAGDEIDKSILLCSLLRSLGSENAKVVVTDSRNSYVLFGFSGRSFVADHSKSELSELQAGQDAAGMLSGKPLYSFNDKEYEDFQESE